MNEVPGMNIINRFADSLEMPVVNLNIRMSLCLCSRKPVTEFGLKSAFASDRVFSPRVVLRLHFKWFVAEKPSSHFAVEGVEVSIKSSKIRQSLVL